MFKIKKFGVASVAKMLGAIYAVMGLIISGFISLFFLTFAGLGTETGILGLLFGIGAIIFLPIFYGLLGMIFGALTAFLYNIIASRLGGIEMELVQ